MSVETNQARSAGHPEVRWFEVVRADPIRRTRDERSAMQAVLPTACGRGGTDLDGQPGWVVGRPAVAVPDEEPQNRRRPRRPSEQFEEAAEIGLRVLSLGR